MIGLAPNQYKEKGVKVKISLTFSNKLKNTKEKSLQFYCAIFGVRPKKFAKKR